MAKEIYVSDGEYLLVKFTEEEKDNYMRLMFPENSTWEFYKLEENRELFFRVTRGMAEIDFSIYNSLDEYCGNVELKDFDSSTPEIGIALLENHRNKGIAGRAIKLLAKRYYEDRENIEYFVLKVSSCNLHSKHMIEKLGAEFAGEEETLLQRSMRLMRELWGEETYEKAQKGYQKECGMSLEEQEEVVYIYHLMPNAFLK